MALLPFTQRKLRSQIPARIPDQSSHDADQDHNHNQAGQKSFAERAGGNQRAELIGEESHGKAGGKLQTHATPEPLTAVLDVNADLYR